MSTIPTEMPLTDPDIETILAKTDPPESLARHTWHVLSRLADQRRMRPRLKVEVDAPRLWHWLYWGTFLHDFGKAADGFQAVMLRRERRWGYRHEALSLAFVDWLFPLNHPDRPFVIAVIACHHRSADEITKRYHLNRDDPDEDEATKLVAQLQPANIRRLYRWLSDYRIGWAEALGFTPDIEFPMLPPLDEALAQVTPRAVHRAVHELKRYTDGLVNADEKQVLTGSLLRGLIVSSDHAGSAHSEAFQPAPLHRETILTTLKTDAILFQHQLQADNAPPTSMLLISPTSSGKTEAALFWFARQQTHDGHPAPRFFYMLPYQASMNAAYDRLKKVFVEKDQVGLQHSRMEQALYAKAFASETDSANAVVYARQQKALAGLLYFPVTVMSPYQLLKVPYQLKGFESLLTNFHGGRFVIDEIHAYEPRRAALIIAMIRYLVRHCAARFFIMTATLPPSIRHALHDAIPDLRTIQADTPTFERFQRHRVHVLSGDLLAPDNLERIVTDAGVKSVLIGCNTVRRALEVSEVLTAALQTRYLHDPVDVIVIHSRFNSRDRNKKEAEILKRTGVNSGERRRTVVIATQVIEVSLNIDLDTIYTEAAPLEALLQRFGRVNRGRPSGILADVYVLREQPDNVNKIYASDLINAALDKLASIDGQPINEALVDTWLAEIYTGEALARWQGEYNASLHAFEQQVMRFFRPFEMNDLDDLFFKMFDGVEVLPMQFLQAYERRLRDGDYMEAAALLVPLAWRDYKILERRQRAWRETFDDRTGRKRNVKGELFVVDVSYSEHSGLDLYTVYQDRLPARTEIDLYDVPSEAD